MGATKVIGYFRRQHLFAGGFIGLLSGDQCSWLYSGGDLSPNEATSKAGPGADGRRDVVDRLVDPEDDRTLGESALHI